MKINSNLYEINTRIFIKRFGDKATLSSIPKEFFKELTELGFSALWLMGAWKTCDNIIDACCFSPDLVSAYSRALKDWRREDVIGSPYSVDCYNLNPMLGEETELLNLREKLNSIGIKLFLDFVPNHFGANSKFIKTNPEVFLEANEEFLQKDPLTFFKPINSDKVFVHGRDPFFLPWTDTVQVNYFSRKARNFMIDQLLHIAKFCDGVRCDMAMLPLNNVFHNTWLGVLNRLNLKHPENEFWKEAIIQVKKKFPGFIFLGETYWDLEWNLQQLGFDFTYDKRLTDRLSSGDINSIKAHLYGNNNYQIKSVRFIENHDEERAVIKFGKEKSYAAAVIISTIKGIKLYYDGQFEGKRIKLPVQLGREPKEKISERVRKHYHTLLKITSEEIFKNGTWAMLEPIPAGVGNNNYSNFFAWLWKLNNDLRIVVINYSESTSQCRLKCKVEAHGDNIILQDLMTNEEYPRSVNDISENGLFVELKGYNSHIFKVTTRQYVNTY